jgi:hypothetical protein
MVLIINAYVYNNKFCKSRSFFALGHANDIKEEHVGKGPIFTNHVDKARIMKREVMPKELQDIHQPLQIPRWMLLSSSV